MNAPQDFRLMTAESVGRDLLQALVTEIKLIPNTWPKLSQAKQDDIIDRLRQRVTDNVTMAVHTLAASGRTTVAGDLEQITIKGGVKAVVTFGAGAENLHDLYEASGKAVLLIVSSADDHMNGMDEVRGEPDQRAMDLGHEYHDNDGGMSEYDGNTIEGEVLGLPAPGDTAPTDEELEAAFDDGYEAAADGKPEQETSRTIKYQHPSNPNQTWSGRGRKPQWVIDWLEAGGSLDELEVGGDEE